MGRDEWMAVLSAPRQCPPVPPGWNTVAEVAAMMELSECQAAVRLRGSLAAGRVEARVFKRVTSDNTIRSVRHYRPVKK